MVWSDDVAEEQDILGAVRRGLGCVRVQRAAWQGASEMGAGGVCGARSECVWSLQGVLEVVGLGVGVSIWGVDTMTAVEGVISAWSAR